MLKITIVQKKKESQNVKNSDYEIEYNETIPIAEKIAEYNDEDD